MTFPLLAVTVSSSRPGAGWSHMWRRGITVSGRSSRPGRLDVGYRSVSSADPCLCDGWVLRDVVGAAFGGRDLGGVETVAAPHDAELQPRHSFIVVDLNANSHQRSQCGYTTTPPHQQSPWPTSTGGPSTLMPWTPTAPPTSTSAPSLPPSRPCRPPTSRVMRSKYGNCLEAVTMREHCKAR
jgi:hypothetical protein